ISLGFIDLQNLDARNRRSEVGIALLSEWQGKHYGTEAMELLLRYAARHLHLHQLYAIVAVENQAAMHMFLRTKFKPSGTLSEWLYNGASGYADASILTCILD
ncbi:MAG: GNAT family N-acetyltransferase, partial [Bacteroidaceae bacterium]|nr:GNAT family N-acetyltransferase [Bacteroidaceae bacterium]